MENKDQINLFKRFLKENDVWANYQKYIKNERICQGYWEGHYGNIVDFFNNVSPSSWVCSCFAWDFTPEGRRVWEKLHHTWGKKYRGEEV